MGLIAFYWLQTLVSARYFVLQEDAPLMKALDLLLPALEPAANVAKLDASARKQADHFMRRLQELGYFREVHHHRRERSDEPEQIGQTDAVARLLLGDLIHMEMKEGVASLVVRGAISGRP